MSDITEELVVLLRELTLRLKNERKLKKGSCFSATEVVAFNIRSIPSSQLEPAVSHIDEGSAEFKVVFDLLTSRTGRISSTEIDSRGGVCASTNLPVSERYFECSSSRIHQRHGVL
jgi:hypothetical protein